MFWGRVHEGVAEFVAVEFQAALSPLLTTLAGITATIKAYDKQIDELSRGRYPERAEGKPMPRSSAGGGCVRWA